MARGDVAAAPALTLPPELDPDRAYMPHDPVSRRVSWILAYRHAASRDARADQEELGECRYLVEYLNDYDLPAPWPRARSFCDYWRDVSDSEQPLLEFLTETDIALDKANDAVLEAARDQLVEWYADTGRPAAAAALRLVTNFGSVVRSFYAGRRRREADEVVERDGPRAFDDRDELRRLARDAIRGPRLTRNVAPRRSLRTVRRVPRRRRTARAVSRRGPPRPGRPSSSGDDPADPAPALGRLLSNRGAR